MDLLTPSSSGNFPTLSLITNSSWLPWRRVVMPLISPLIPVPLSFWCGYACQMLLYIADSCCSCYFYLLVLKIRQKQRIMSSTAAAVGWIGECLICFLEPLHSPLLCILPDVLEQPDLMDILRVSSQTLCVYAYTVWSTGTKLGISMEQNYLWVSTPHPKGQGYRVELICFMLFGVCAHAFWHSDTKFCHTWGDRTQGSPCLDYLALFQWIHFNECPPSSCYTAYYRCYIFHHYSELIEIHNNWWQYIWKDATHSLLLRTLSSL